MDSRLLSAIGALVRQIVGHTDYHAMYLAEVRSQNDDLTLEVKPFSAKLPGFSRVVVRGLPGVEVRVAQGAQVLLGFEDGSPERPYASLFRADSLKEIRIRADTKVIVSSPDVLIAESESAARPVAREGDIVKFTIPLPPPTGPLDVYGLIAGGATKVRVQ
jgi:hypothetical protein